MHTGRLAGTGPAQHLSAQALRVAGATGPQGCDITPWWRGEHAKAPWRSPSRLAHTGRMQLRIEGHTLPGRECGAGPGFPGAGRIEVAVQRKDRPAELLDPQPADARTATWTLACTFTADGGLRGPYVQNRLGGRFVYLSWVGRQPQEAASRMFRRAKLMLADVPPEVLAEARRRGALVGRLALTDAKGEPLCGRVVPPAVVWSAGEPSDA